MGWETGLSDLQSRGVWREDSWLGAVIWRGSVEKTLFMGTLDRG